VARTGFQANNPYFVPQRQADQPALSDSLGRPIVPFGSIAYAPGVADVTGYREMLPSRRLPL